MIIAAVSPVLVTVNVAVFDVVPTEVSLNATEGALIPAMPGWLTICQFRQACCHNRELHLIVIIDNTVGICDQPD